MELVGCESPEHQNEDILRDCVEFRWPVLHKGRLGRLFQALERPEPLSAARAVGLAVASTAVVFLEADQDGGGESRIAPRVF